MRRLVTHHAATFAGAACQIGFVWQADGTVARIFAEAPQDGSALARILSGVCRLINALILHQAGLSAIADDMGAGEVADLLRLVAKVTLDEAAGIRAAYRAAAALEGASRRVAFGEVAAE